MHDNTTTWMLLTSTPLGGVPLGALGLLFLLVLRKRPSPKHQKALLVGLGLAVIFILWAYTMGATILGGERINTASFVPKTILPLLWGVGILQLLEAVKSLWTRRGKTFIKNTILPAVALVATLFYTGFGATLTVTAPQTVVQIDGTIDLSVQTGFFTPPGYLLVSLQRVEHPKKGSRIGNSYTSSDGGPLTEQTIFVFPGATTQLSVPADETWCAPTDEPIICRTAPGDYVVSATLFGTPGMSVGWPHTWPQKPLVNAKSAPFMLRDGEANPDDEPAQMAMHDALKKRFSEATLGSSDRLSESLTLQMFEHQGDSYCSVWAFPKPFLGEMEACITSYGTNGTTGYFDANDTVVRRFDLRVPQGMYTPREAVIQGKKAALLYGQTHSLYPTEATHRTNRDYELTIDLILTETTIPGSKQQWKVGVRNRTLNPGQITVLLDNNGKACITTTPWYETKKESTECAMTVDVVPPKE